MQFHQLGLTPALMQALERAGYETPTPIQQQAIGPALEGRDILGCAQTGTGKTAAFALPILQRLGARAAGPGVRPVRALVLTPTRELAAQVADSLRTYGHFMRLATAVIFGGVPERPQIDALRRGVDIVVATPGRLLDLMGQGHARLGSVSILVLDEADRMLDMGFLPAMKKIVARVPAKRQTLLFSATLAPEIRDLAHGLLSNPVSVSVVAESAAADTVEQCVYFVDRERKQALLARLLGASAVTRALVFTRTKHRADRVARALTKAGTRAEAIHGNKSQGQRTRALRGFESGETRVLVASDIASRGLDITEVSHVFNFDLPNEPETYVHRIGRTGRAGATGIAVSFCDHEERAFLRDIERLIGRRVPIAAGFRDEAPAQPSAPAPGPTGRQQPWRHPNPRQQPARQQPSRQQPSRPQHGRREDSVRRGDSGRAARREPDGRTRGREDEGRRGPWRQPRSR